MNQEPRTILVVDDDIDLLEQLKTLLEASGYRVLTAAGEREAADLLRTHRPHLAVLDLMMEHQDSGFILAYRIKKMDPAIPVIIVTAVTSQTGIHFDASGGDEQSWIKADAILEKDIRPEQLLGEVRRLLKE